MARRGLPSVRDLSAGRRAFSLAFGTTKRHGVWRRGPMRVGRVAITRIPLEVDFPAVITHIDAREVSEMPLLPPLVSPEELRDAQRPLAPHDHQMIVGF